MKILFAGMILASTLVLRVPLAAQQPDYEFQARTNNVALPDTAIAGAIQGISAAHVHKTIETLVSFHNRNTLSSMETDLPKGAGVTAAADWIYAEFELISRECNGCLEVHRDTFTESPMDRIPHPTTITNVYAVLRGTDPEQAKRMYLVTGHYDSRNGDVLNTHDAAPGANDDASGVAVSIESARALSRLKFPATIVFAAVAGEEQGLNGSTHLAKLARSQGWQLEGVLNNDIVGGNTTPGDTLQLKDRVRIFSEGVPALGRAPTPEQVERVRNAQRVGGEFDSPSRELARAIADVARSYALKAPGDKVFSPFLVFRADRYLRGGDHSSFNREGFAAVRFTEWREDFNHQHQFLSKPEDSPVKGDLLEFVDFNYVADVAALNAATLATLASAPGPTAHVQIVTEKLENGTTLRWEPVVGAHHYEVLWRETTAPDWQYVQAVIADGKPGQITVTMPASKDNVFFGVRAVDAAGHRGLVVAP